MKNQGREWVKDAVMYQIYPQSYCDSNGDGIGDLKGISAKLDYIQSLGVNLLWLNPCFDSPFVDAGYDVRDFYRIAPRYGTNQDMADLIAQVHQRDMRICLDLVAGHSSVECEWFRQSASTQSSEYDTYYIWSDQWCNIPESGQWVTGYAPRDGCFRTNFFWCQPSLNYGYLNPAAERPWEEAVDGEGPQAVVAELKNIMKHWLDMGCDGFRVDMASSLVKNDPDQAAVCSLWKNDLQPWIRTNYPHAVMIAEWGHPTRAIADAGFDMDFLLHCGAPGYAEMFFNRAAVAGRKTDGNCFFCRSGRGSAMPFINEYLAHAAHIATKGFIAVESANHDFQRMNWDRTTEELKVIYAFIFTWTGVPSIYYGDEIGMRFIPDLPSKEGAYTRTGTRTPMQWDRSRNAGFSSAAEEDLYLPLDPDVERPTVEAQEDDEGSLLNHIRRLIRLRQSTPALGNEGELELVLAEDKTYPLIYRRSLGDDQYLVALNPSSNETENIVAGMPAARDAILSGGCRMRESDAGTVVSMDPVSFGIFRCGAS